MINETYTNLFTIFRIIVVIKVTLSKDHSGSDITTDTVYTSFDKMAIIEIHIAIFQAPGSSK